MGEIPPIATYFDEIEEANGDDEYKAWLRKARDAKYELAHFAASRRGKGRATEYVGFLEGSFNVVFRFKFSDGGPDAIIRFPKPGHTATALRYEKVANEVQVLEYLRRKTSIPVPSVHSWGPASESPQQLGPFIVMEWIEGVTLSKILRQPKANDKDEQLLNPKIDDALLDKVYDQIAGYLLQLSLLPFTRIGAISEDNDTWSVASRPLTYNINELATVSGCSVELFPNTTFARASDYLTSATREHLVHLRTQRNLAVDRDIARARFIARHRFTQLIPKYCVADTGPFFLFCEDLRPCNMLVNPDTLQITAVLDFEFTNAMPAQFSYDPPWWLLLRGLDNWLERPGGLEEFKRLYEPRMEQFLRALKAVEDLSITAGRLAPEARLSDRMRESWISGRFWFNYASRRSFSIDSVYWSTLHSEGAGIEVLDEETQVELEPFLKSKMEQLKAYNQDLNARFSKASACNTRD